MIESKHYKWFAICMLRKVEVQHQPKPCVVIQSFEINEFFSYSYLFIVRTPILISGGHNMQMMDYGYGSMMSGWGILIWIFWILVIVGLALLIKYLLEGRGGQESALEVLKKRYAGGEITKEEFEKKKKYIL